MKRFYQFTAMFCISTALGCYAWLVVTRSAGEAVSLKAVRAVEQPIPGEESGTQIVYWNLVNNTPSPVIIESILTNCGCTVVKRSPKSLPGSEVAEVITERRFTDERGRLSNYTIHVQYVRSEGSLLEAVAKTLTPVDLATLQE